MENQYKLIISNKNLYKEIELTSDMDEIKIGTSSDSNIRLRRELFFLPIELYIKHNNDGWNVSCSDQLYFTMGDVRKLLTKNLTHGEELSVHYQESNHEVFILSFMIDFDSSRKDYNVAINLNGQNEISIGGKSSCAIELHNDYLGTDAFSLQRRNDGWYVVDNNTMYGVFVNGMKIKEEAQLSNTDFFSIVGFSFYYKNDTLYTCCDHDVSIHHLSYRQLEQYETHMTYPKFNRNTRIQYIIPEEDLEIQQAMTKPQKSKKNLLFSLIPSLVMLAMTIVLRGVIGGGGTFVIYSAVSMGIGVIMSIVTYIQEKKEYKKEWDKRIEMYQQYIQEKRKLIENARADEIRIRNLIYESLEHSVQEATVFGKRLFERSIADVDFLQIYLGKGKITSANQVKFTKQEFIDTEDPLATIPEDVAKEYEIIEEAPIISDFNASCGIGIVGNKPYMKEVLKNITLDISIRHFYYDVKFVYILEDNEVDELSWIRWLHNVENERLDVRNIVCDEESRNIVLEDIYIELSTREIIVANNKDAIFDDYYVVFITDTANITRHPVSKYFRDCNRYGFTFVFFEEYEELLPQGCTEIIRLENDKVGSVLKTEDGDQITQFLYPTISNEIAAQIALKLSAINVDEVSLEQELTKNITMFEMLDILSVEDIDLSNRWASSMVYKSLAAPIGVKSKNQIVSLDISDKASAHGPHGLVAGTTGSGKSEVLQTYILSIATLFHPYEVGFVIIDFKGGGMANQFKELPHLIGTITNIDGREIQRSLLSIKAELVKRQEIFSKNNVNHINDYIKLYKTNKVKDPLPHLIMIVDEFAELKMEYPDFMKELISAARIGRTLGVHLILATQKPAGVVDAQIWSNSKFKLCLKVQTKEDSNEVIKTPLAAEIVEPGRAYFQVGNNEIFDLVQSAYSGAMIPEGNENNERVFSIYERNSWGKKTLMYTNKKKKKQTESVTQLQAIVDHVQNYCLQQQIRRLPGICLPSLAERISTKLLSYEQKQTSGFVVPIGIYDDPEQQLQDEVNVEVSRDNFYIIGSAQTGKTVLLQTMIYGLCRKYTPDQIHFYLIDCGSMVLKIFEEANHVGGVVLPNEDEKCKNLFKLLNQTIAERKKIFSSKGVGNYAAYLEAEYEDLPMIVVMIDNMAAFKEYFPNEAEDINSLSRESLSVGISLVVTAATSNALNYRTQANFSKKFVLNCNDDNEYSNVFGHCRQTPKENAGRGLFMMEKRIIEYQTAIFGDSLKEAERSQELIAYIVQRNQECPSKAKEIPMVPTKLALSKCMRDEPQAFRVRRSIPIGMDYESVSLASIHMNNAGSLALLGDAESRELFTNNLLQTLAQTAIYHEVEAIIIDDKYKKLESYRKHGFVRDYTSDVMEGTILVSEFCDDIALGNNDNEEDTLKLLIINSNEVFKKICSDKKDSKNLSEAIKNAVDQQAFIICTTVENQAVGFNSSDVLKTIKDERYAIFFAPLRECKMLELSGRVKQDVIFDTSMGYYFNRSNVSKIKIFDER